MILLARTISKSTKSLRHDVVRPVCAVASSTIAAAAVGASGHRYGRNSGTSFASDLPPSLLLGIGAASFVSLLSSSSSPTTQCEKSNHANAVTVVDLGAPFPLEPLDNKEIPGPVGIPSRVEQVRRLRTSSAQHPYDILVVGGGATGCGVALDAVTRTIPSDPSRKFTVACIERGDFASETSSRSTKLIWAGIKYLASASASLLSLKLLTSPIQTVNEFVEEFNMVFQCHQERKFMLDKQRHLTNWVPIVCPFTEWHKVWPPPFGHWLFSFFPILAPIVFKFYDSLSQFTCPPSYILTKKETRMQFPQLNEKEIKYCAVFYEGQHNDARTNLAIAMSAAEKGAHIANYVEMIDCIFNDAGKVIGIQAVDRVTGDKFQIYANHVVFAGGPFTDSLREKESRSGSDEQTMTSAVQGASGSHIVLPGYYAPNNMGLLDYNTSDGRFLFFLPWQGSVIVGTTDKKGPAETLPTAPEEEIQWILKECEKYLSHDLKVRRSDVLSAWRGWRPLAADPHAPPGGQVSRDHVISTNPNTGVTFIAGGKWTTWREMAQDVVDKVLGRENGDMKCNTLDITLHGGDGYSNSLSVELIQKYCMDQKVAEHLVKTYGGRVWEVADKAKPTGKRWPRYGVQLVEGYPYIEAEVRYACQEYACTIEDILSRRTRLAFLNKDASMEALPRVADIMAEELGWSKRTKASQIKAAQKYLESYGGRIPQEDAGKVSLPLNQDVISLFEQLDTDGNGFLDIHEIKDMSERLGRPLSDKYLKKVFDEMDRNRNGKIEVDEFIHWLENSKDSTGFAKALNESYRLGGKAWLKRRSTTFLG
ncbi:hypothetical protein ACHAWX_003712 [Stephanocyclus meneghinianus]